MQRCKKCLVQSPDSCLSCEYCGTRFEKPAAAAPKPAVDPMSLLSKEQLLSLPAEQLLKSEEKMPQLPPWLRPLTWIFLAVFIMAGGLMLLTLQARYRRNRPSAARAAPPVSAVPDAAAPSEPTPAVIIPDPALRGTPFPETPPPGLTPGEAQPPSTPEPAPPEQP